MEKPIKAKSIRTFIGARDFDQSRSFYNLIGFEEITLGDKPSLFKLNESILFLLQDFYVKDWVENTMLMLEVEDIEAWLSSLQADGVASKYEKIKLTEITEEEWGKVFYLHDPSGNLWHFCQFKD